MQRQVYVRFEWRSNDGTPLKTLERLAVFDDKDDPDYLSETLEEWAADTARSMSVLMTITKAQIKQLRQEAIRRLVS